MTSLQMPKVQQSIISNKNKIVTEIGKILKKENILSDEDEIRPYETDALTAYRQKPLLVVGGIRQSYPQCLKVPWFRKI